LRILFVDDNSMNRSFVDAVLTPAGHVVETEVGGTEGLARATREVFDLIILDVELPGIRGDMICERLRAAGQRTPIVALTASALPYELAALGRSGFDLILTKPIDPHELRSKVAQFDPTARR
jgi:CheY-like chemotaxis protein